MQSLILAPIDRLGRRVINAAQYVYQLGVLFYLSMKHFLRTLIDQSTGRQKGIRAIFRVVVMQVYFTAVQSLPIITLMGLIIGSVVILQSVTQLSKFGGIQQIGEFIVPTIIRDVGPLLTILIIIARSGTAISSEIATMKVNREVDALEAMGISTLDYIVVPRVVAGVASVLCISIWFSAVAILGGYFLAALLMNLHWQFFIDRVMLAMTGADIALFLTKNLVGGGAVFLIACLQGLSANIASYEVPIVTIGCVVRSLTFVLAFHGLLTALFYVWSQASVLQLLMETFTL